MITHLLVMHWNWSINRLWLIIAWFMSPLGKDRLSKLDVVKAGDDVSKKKPDPMIYNMAQATHRTTLLYSVLFLSILIGSILTYWPPTNPLNRIMLTWRPHDLQHGSGNTINTSLYSPLSSSTVFCTILFCSDLFYSDIHFSNKPSNPHCPPF